MKVGDKLYEEYNGKEMTVTKVGKKYFEVDNSREKFFISTMRTWDNAFRHSTLCPDKEGVMGRIEETKLYEKFRNDFSLWNRKAYSLEQLRKVDAILNPPSNLAPSAK